MNHPKIRAKSGREFASHSAGLVALIINSDERFLMLRSPKQTGYEPVNGGFEGGESILDGMLREIREEAGADVRVRPMCSVHSSTFRYDDSIPHMLSMIFLFEYLGGDVLAGDDMAGSEVRWLSAADIRSGDYEILVPRLQLWVYERAVKLYRLLKDENLPPLQVDMSQTRNKYGE